MVESATGHSIAAQELGTADTLVAQSELAENSVEANAPATNNDHMLSQG